MSLTTTINSPDPTNAESDQHDHDDHADDGGAHAGNHCDRQIAIWHIRDLKQHPLQSDYFPDESEQADQELAASLGAEGQRDPIHILPEGTILSGHRRVKAAKRLEWETINVIVQHELADDQAAAEAFFIDDNYTRRQLTEFQKVRCAKRRVELANLGKVALPNECAGLKKTRDKIGKLMNISGREADRYLRVLKTPIEVQHACDAGHLSLVEAGTVAGFSEATQKLIAEALREQGLEAAKMIYDAHRSAKAATRRGAQSIWCDLRRVLQLAKQELVGNTGNLHWLDQEDLDLIEQVEDELFSELKIHIIERIEQQQEDDALDDLDTDDSDQEVKIPPVPGGAQVDTVSTAMGLERWS